MNHKVIKPLHPTHSELLISLLTTFLPSALNYEQDSQRLLDTWGKPHHGRQRIKTKKRNLEEKAPGSQASSRGEAKDSALLSSRDAGLL